MTKTELEGHRRTGNHRAQEQTEDRIQQTGRGGHTECVIDEREEQVPADITHCRSAQEPSTHETAEISFDEGDPGTLHRDVRSGSHRDTHIGGGRYDAIAETDSPPRMSVTLDDLRRLAVTRSLFTPTTLKRALHKLGFVQADPIRAPARAQDLMLRHRVRGYRAGDLERRYATLDIEEDFLVNYGFVTRAVQALMHPRATTTPWPAARKKRAQALLEFVRERGAVHPREVDEYFSHGTVTNYWGGASSATTHLLDEMHYRGLLRVVRREGGIRIYAAHEHAAKSDDAAVGQAQIDLLVDVVVRKYAPLPGGSLASLVSRLRYGVPQWGGELKKALQRAHQQLAHTRIDGVDWYWPADERPPRCSPQEGVRLLAPFDPVVWDRRRFELFWGWPYRFEAYTPAPKRKLGYYALPLLWRDRVIGWGNLAVKNSDLQADFGYVASHPPHDRLFQRELEAELNRMRIFLDFAS
jgi:uncharacterized protein YcaQ